MEREYYILNPEKRSAETQQENIKAWLADQATAFYQEQLKQERDYCFWCRMIETAKQDSLESYTSMAYTLTDPNMLNSAAKINFILGEEEALYIHTVAVVRDGSVIDKMGDINIKVLDHVRDGDAGSFDNEKKLTILSRDLHLNDIFIIETTTVRQYVKESIRNKFYRHLYTFPSSYWAYGSYHMEFKNETGQRLEGNYHYFRDDEGVILEKPSIILEDQESFSLTEQQYIRSESHSLVIEPFIDFVTQKTYPEITAVLADIYNKFYEVDVATFAQDLLAELNDLPSLDHKIKHVIDFVQKEIYYLYNAAEMDGHEPQAPEITFKSKQGDCKAKSVLLKVLLNYLGVESHPILVHYDADLFLPVYSPSPFNYNHMILKVYYHDDIYFIDATSRVDQGFLDKRQKYSFINYLEIKAGTVLQQQSPFTTALPAIEEVIHCDVKENIATFTLKSVLRGGVANRVRQMFKNQTNKDIIMRYNESVHRNMVLYNNFDINEIDDHFTGASIIITEDNKDLNEVNVTYNVTISDPYKIEDGKRYLHYWDRHYFLNDQAEDHHHKDFPYWVDRDSVKMAIHLTSDRPIDQEEMYTRQECDLSSAYLKHRTTKKISKYGASCYLEYEAYGNLPLYGDELIEYIKINEKIRDSNFGIGVDIIKEGVFAKIGKLFQKR